VAEGMQAAGQVISGVGQYEAGKYNAKVANTQAIEIERNGAAEEERTREAARMQMGQQIAAQAGGGFQLGTGSALDALTQSQVNAALDALTIRREAAGRARSQRISGSIAKAQGENGLVTGMLGAATTIANTNADWAAARQGTTAKGGH
jgi:hypothetical protein